ncbi:MAG: hypothetical protein K0Q49_2491 [Haloplasmataceae bacterium]|nr:hypothetical protein [Haloplasmataceae bacterium]
MGGDSIKRFIRYFIWTLVIILLLYLGTEIQLRLIDYQAQYFNAVPLITFNVFFPIFMGIIIRLPQLLSEKIHKKQLQVDWVKLSVIGIPSLCVALSPFLILLNTPLFIRLFVIQLISSDFSLTSLAGFISVYLILDSLKVNLILNKV